MRSAARVRPHFLRSGTRHELLPAGSSAGEHSDLAGGAVDTDASTIGHARGRVAGADDGRDSELASHDCGVTKQAAGSLISNARGSTTTRPVRKVRSSPDPCSRRESGLLRRGGLVDSSLGLGPRDREVFAGRVPRDERGRKHERADSGDVVEMGLSPCEPIEDGLIGPRRERVEGPAWQICLERMSDQALGPCELTPYGNGCPQEARDRAVPLQWQPRGHHDNLLRSMDLALTGPAKSGHGSSANVATAAFAMPCAHFGGVLANPSQDADDTSLKCAVIGMGGSVRQIRSPSHGLVGSGGGGRGGGG